MKAKGKNRTAPVNPDLNLLTTAELLSIAAFLEAEAGRVREIVLRRRLAPLGRKGLAIFPNSLAKLN